ncbi:hypothetical protein [Candidatus Epulonipiscium viviparus]|uniref:hypothetical protein n=1 Tax=Candidatus Epulonipiscium viviparus TaxID=420336 RepID=UPI00273814B4|nr:hypothetical protein [Candidatus Epulopiscium viviparus]
MALGLNSDMNYSIQNNDRNADRATAQIREIQQNLEERRQEQATAEALPQSANIPTGLSVGSRMVSAYIGLTVETSNVESQNENYTSDNSALNTTQTATNTAQNFTLTQNNILTIQPPEDTTSLYTTEEEEDALALYEDTPSPQEELEARIIESRAEREAEQEALTSEREAELNAQQAETSQEISEMQEETLEENINAENIAATANTNATTAATSTTLKTNLLDQYRFQMQSRWQTSAMNMMNQMSTLFNV